MKELFPIPMDIKMVNTLANVVMAFSTFIGVGGATAFYMKEIKNFDVGYIIMAIVVYILLLIVVLQWIKEKLK